MDLIGLLQAKNRCLSRLFQLTERYLSNPSVFAIAPSQIYKKNNSTNGEDPYEELLLQREMILKAVQLFDKKIEEIAKNISQEHSAIPLADIQACLHEREVWVAKILKLDEKLVEQLEIKKAEILKELVSNQKNSDQLGKFRSQPATARGEGLDQKL